MTEMVMKQTSPRFWNRIAQKYAKSPVKDEDAYQTKLRLTQALMTKDMDALELGCGTGSTALVHAPHVRTYTATDFSSQMIEIAREKAWDASLPNLTFEIGASEDLVQGPKQYDMILALSLLHLVPGWRGLLPKIYDRLTPGGYFVSSTVCLGELAWYMKAIFRPLSAVGIFPPVEMFVAKTLRDEILSHGFEVVEDWLPRDGRTLFLIVRKPLQ